MGRRERNESSMWLALANNILEVRTKLINGMTETFVFYSEETEARRAKEKAIRIKFTHDSNSISHGFLFVMIFLWRNNWTMYYWNLFGKIGK